MFVVEDVVTKDWAGLTSGTFFPTVSTLYAMDEEAVVSALIEYLDLAEDHVRQVTTDTTALVQTIRGKDNIEDSLDALLREYNLTTKEGLVLMCLAEALLRIPDKQNADALIKDKIAGVNWGAHKGKSDKSLVNFATWGLVLTGKIVDTDDTSGVLKQLTHKLSEPVIRLAVYKAMKVMGRQFVLGRFMGEALRNGQRVRESGYTYTFDMLGEAALTQSDADRYFNSYKDALITVSSEKALANSKKPSLSIKLSALHPRYEVGQKDRVLTELFLRVKALAVLGRERDVEISIDAEESDRLELSLELFEKLLRDPEIKCWGGLGLVVQAYAKSSLATLIWVTLLGRELETRIPIRLVKGAYWDTEIKAAQVRGLSNYPVYTRKENTDVSYLACAKYLLSDATKGVIAPQFATHNAQTVQAILAMGQGREFEFQRLHGMGEALYDEIIARTQKSVRIYAPVGAHSDLLPYLVRRLLENGANSSFVHQLVNPEVSIQSLAQHPVEQVALFDTYRNPTIALPPNIYAQGRKNSLGININIAAQWNPFAAEFNQCLQQTWKAVPLINGEPKTSGSTQEIMAPFEVTRSVGTVTFATQEMIHEALDSLENAWFSWNATEVEMRAKIIEKLADLLEQHRPELMALCSLEAGKTIQDGIDEIREAVDFCRYYASEARTHGKVQILQGVTGERNEYYNEGKGIFVCISPWNFPLAIYLGQITAALVAGNVVLAKPAEQTSLIAYRAVELLFEAGLPKQVLAFIPAFGRDVGAVICSDPRVAGVCFTGSTLTAKKIQRYLTERVGSIATFIAETGGQNVMVADSTALPEQVVKDALQSAFVSAGQRCSALRVLYLQEEIADRMIELLKGALNDLVVGLPFYPKTDLGPVIDARAQTLLMAHIDALRSSATLIGQAPISTALNGYFVAPTIFEIDSINQLEKENFGPILHIVRYKRDALAEVIAAVNATGYGLTMGVHSRNDATIDYIERFARVGNFYVNRNQVGAVVGVQPFGGRGLSGTGPKAGGPNYLRQFMTERATSINTAAIGGNAALLTLHHES